MKQTKNYLLNLLETTDVLSVRPLNENVEKIDAALREQQTAIDGKLMLATGTYTGDGSRSVTIQTPGFKPEVLLLVQRSGSSWSAAYGISWWIGSDIDISYKITAASEESGEQFDSFIRSTIRFHAEQGKISWSIPPISSGYYDVTTDEGPADMKNNKAWTYEWVALGTAE